MVFSLAFFMEFSALAALCSYRMFSYVFLVRSNSGRQSIAHISDVWRYVCRCDAVVGGGRRDHVL